MHLCATRTSDSGCLDLAILFIFRRDELDRFSIGQTTESLRLDFTLVNEYVSAAIIRDDEAISLQGVEPGVSENEMVQKRDNLVQ